MATIGWILLIFVGMWFVSRAARGGKVPNEDRGKRLGLAETPHKIADPPEARQRVGTRPAPAASSSERSRPVSSSTARSGPGLLSELVTVELVLEGRSARNVPIPEKRSRYREIDVGNGETFAAELLAYGSGFVEQAAANAEKIGEPAEHVPFKAYWSSYSDMDAAQRRWYYYWRNEVRNGRYPPTDLSYIFVHVYECIHGIGFNTLLHAYGHLWALWHKYRQQHPRLDSYLMRWMLDLNAYYEVGMDSLDIVRSSVGAATSGISSDLIIASLATKNGETPTVDQLALIAKFDPRSGKFYREFNDTNLIDRTLQLGFRALDDYFRETVGSGVVEAHQPKRQVKLTNVAFAGALFSYQPKEVFIAEVGAYSRLTKFPKLVEDTLKLSENILRKQVSFAGQRRGIELPTAIEERIKAILGDSASQPVEQQRKRRSLRIDSSRAEMLRAQSIEIRAELIASMQTNQSSETGSTRFELPPSRRPNELTDVDSVANVLDKLVATAADLIHTLRESGWEGEVLSPNEVDEVNRHALLELGEPLLVTESDRLLVADDYRDELAFLLDHSDYARLATSSNESSASHGSGWDSLKNAMTSVQLAAVKVVANGISTAEFETFAHDHSSMGALLLDEINELALNYVGDNIVESEDGRVTVYEDYLDDVRKMLQG